MKMVKVLTLFLLIRNIEAFISSPKPFVRLADQSLAMIGGIGWGNDDFLSSLGGSDDEKQEAKEKYDEFKGTREAFNERQQERMESPAGKKFMQDMMQNQQQGASLKKSDDVDSDGGFFEDIGFAQLPNEGGSGKGGSRFDHMMRQATAKKMGQSGNPGMDTFERKLVVPLEDADFE
jgi:hypothetical protein